MIRSANHSLKFANEGKREALSVLVDEYRSLLQDIIDHAWLHGIPEFAFNQSKNKLDMKSLLPTSYLQGFETWLSARMRQAAGKQAVMMLKASVKKRQKQLFMLKKLQRQGKPTKYLQSKIDRQQLVKHNAANAKLGLTQDSSTSPKMLKGLILFEFQASAISKCSSSP